ncbi:response regulator transcription factor [Pseudomonas vanderleydeniana]|uniref:LuxR C-terminal-related transcriptional regulator n=1 Tax=Pseudomonas vanderleydeniana TaxID=2745495 RepID=A0A9E6PS65_9PSED|nr:LuxR C-terminal-related transcriptional regulator [Pseudomonas vanderleydeniana]QXI31240.1 LuxR C-terminal-related transcriptional regulator [Pseudomonas vanderleydeniana]
MASNRLTTQDWYRHLANVTCVIGQPGFVDALFAALCYLAPSQGTMVYLFPRQGLPSALAETQDDGPWLPQGSIREYIDGHCLLCPFYRAAMEGASAGCYQLADVAPDHFKRSEYYLSFYQHSHLEDEVNYLVPLGTELVIAVELATTGTYSASQVRDLKCVTPWVLAVVSQHWRYLESQVLGGRFESAIERQVSSALSNFGASVLTERECGIVQLLLRGYSSKSLAERLGVSEDTIKSHRKNIYVKLDISSQSELFSLFINSLALARDGLGKDPLAYYLDHRH